MLLLGQKRIFGSQSVARTPEIERITAMPRRAWSEAEGERLARDMTRELKTPRGTMHLRPVQAIALYELMEVGGLFGPIRVGHGKTLVSLLAPLVLEARRPLLLLPAALIEKTVVDRRALTEHWRLPVNLQLLSYEMLGLVQSADRLDYIAPDLIVADEGHRLKNLSAGRTRRVARYVASHPDTKFVVMSGTVMKSSIVDFSHLVHWCLKDRSPLPRNEEEVKQWAEALDEGVNPLVRRRPGALLDLAPAWPLAQDVATARQVFQSRLLETRGVVASSRSDDVDCSLVVSALEYDVAEVTKQHVKHLRATWTTPDGWAFSEALEFRRYMRELALGFHAIWDPRPPAEWLAARKAWATCVREVLEDSDHLDTELQVARAVDAGQVDDDGVLDTWRQVKETFTVQPKPVWHDDSALKVCAAWMVREKGIVWTEHVFFARRLAEMTGVSYYGANGLNDRGESITHVRAGSAIIASVQANGTGRNLQCFDKNLVTSCPSGAQTWEQLLGRTHRDGQQADEVRADVLLGCSAHWEALDGALSSARAAADTLGHDQKLLLATIAFPGSVAGRSGPMWRGE
jgi:hypothetical protein